MNSPQSWQSMLVDLAIIAAVVLFAVKGVHDAEAWSLLAIMVGGRFGVAAGKMIERAASQKDG